MPIDPKGSPNGSFQFPKNSYRSLLAVLLVVFLVYAPSLKNDFVNWDDDLHVMNNRLVNFLDPEHVRDIFISAVNLTYIPLTILSFAVEKHFFGLNPFVYHLDNLLLHLAVTALVFIFTLRLGASRQAAAVAALVFGVHPMHVESVAWVTERKDVLYGLFFMLALAEYQAYLRSRKFIIYARVFLWGLLSILAKPMALSLPLVLLLLDLFDGRRDWKALIWEKAILLIYVAPIVSITQILNTNITIIHRDLFKAFLILVWTLTFYIHKFVCPFILIPNYSVPEPVSLFNVRYALAVAIFVLALWCIIRHRKDRWVIFAGSFYMVTIFLILRMTDTITKGAAADRYMYMPSVGFCILLGVWWDRIREHYSAKSVILRRVMHVCLAVVIAVLCWKTYLQTRIWKDSVALWSNVITYAEPARPFFFNNRGSAYLDQGRYSPALADFNRALAMDPNQDDVLYNRAEVFKHFGQYDLAINDLNRAIGLNPEFADAYNNLGSVYEIQEKYDQALTEFNKAVAIDPYLDKGYSNRGVIFAIQGRYDLALADFNKALAIDPDLTDALKNRGSLYRIQKQYDLALVDLNKALAAAPEPNVYVNRGLVYGLKGKHELAVADYDRALAIDPNIGMAYVYRGIAEIGQKLYKEAVADLTKAIALEPDNGLAYEKRALIYSRIKEDALAVKDLDQVIRLKSDDGRVYFNRSVCYRNMHRNDKALTDALKAKSLGYGVPEEYFRTLNVPQ